VPLLATTNKTDFPALTEAEFYQVARQLSSSPPTTTIEKMATTSDDGAQATKEASLLGISVELRLKIYSFLLKREGPIDTLLIPANEQMIWRNARLANAQDVTTSVRIWAELRRWDERNDFFVCRVLLGEASEYFYHNNTFDFYSPTQCLTWQVLFQLPTDASSGEGGWLTSS
jgi:hypothetical protein